MEEFVPKNIRSVGGACSVCARPLRIYKLTRAERIECISCSMGPSLWCYCKFVDREYAMRVCDNCNNCKLCSREVDADSLLRVGADRYHKDCYKESTRPEHGGEVEYAYDGAALAWVKIGFRRVCKCGAEFSAGPGEKWKVVCLECQKRQRDKK